eukprot:CAMPEP_0177609358 /NCGR_PEP_ID=MMETSP0419_2-20121207/19034_1 /TAXON_ID=582737 /ORGANISM="Tetraselmis sp., Strain GSL018" /LENGTH=120 /DNA_ID=CAMNT_0019104253 /DNA_START=194 /DNA_END=557 /DNA_ORIENTATION=-
MGPPLQEDALEEVVWRPPRDLWLSPSRRRLKLVELLPHVLVQLHDRGLVPTAVAVVRGAEYSHHVLLVAPVVSLHDQLMRTGHQLEAVGVVELLADVLAKSVPGSSRRDPPAVPVVRVGP